MDEIWHRLLQDRADVTLPLGFVLALLVTFHVLLRKREVATSVGWIGLAWFAPFTGTVAYFLLGINRVQRRAQRLRSGEARSSAAGDGFDLDNSAGHLDVLREGVRQITGRVLLAGNTIEVFQDGDEAYPPMLAAIALAEHSVGLSSYIFRNDAWGRRFIDTLSDARTRGVEVRVLIDGIGGGWLLSSAYHDLRRRGVIAARFLHSLLPWRMPFLNLRSHRKILVIDGRVSFTGGLNIADGNVLASRPSQPVMDTHFRFEGPVVRQLTDAFAEDWLFAADEALEGEAWFPDLPSLHGPLTARVIDSGPDEDIEKIEFAMLQAVACARINISVMTPYFLPDDRMVGALSLAAMRGVKVNVVIPEKNDHTLVAWATCANIGPLLTDGVRIWLCPPPFRHTKLMIVDGAWFLVGSCNWDVRSFLLNFELCVEGYDEKLCESLSLFAQSCRGRELKAADLRQRPFVVRLRDAAARLLLPYL